MRERRHATGDARLRGRARRAAAWEAKVAARLPLGPDGIVRGAGPIALDADGDRGALVLHGFGDTPESVATVAHGLHARGWTVDAPLLAGHGRDLRTFARSGAADWLASARAAYAALRARRARVAIVAQSMGGALAAVLADEAARAPGAGLPALVLLAPYLDAPASVRWGARLAPLLALGTPYLSSDGGARSLHDPAARAVSLGPKVVAPRLVRELARAVAWGRAALPGIAAPTLVVASRQDNRIAPAAMTAAVARIGRDVPGATAPTLVWLERCGHVIAADHERDAVAAHAGAWLDAHVPADA
ncbi:hypothetical protein tb265_10150 [Gemmatimonadetes bacterium T265]|nr:hypothetical protein tb265_10150 [Gemmatimonadetes bacterium T265]